jgi:hypothetical protein
MNVNKIPRRYTHNDTSQFSFLWRKESKLDTSSDHSRPSTYPVDRNRNGNSQRTFWWCQWPAAQFVGLHSKDCTARFATAKRSLPPAGYSHTHTHTHTQIYTVYHIKHKIKTIDERTTQHRGAFGVTTVAVEEQQVILHITRMCLCSCLRYLARALLYWHMWPVWPYHLFNTSSHKRHDFRGGIYWV